MHTSLHVGHAVAVKMCLPSMVPTLISQPYRSSTTSAILSMLTGCVSNKETIYILWHVQGYFVAGVYGAGIWEPL